MAARRARSGGPDVEARGQGGLGDIILHPDFATTGQVYLSYVARDADNDELSGAVVELAKLTLTRTGGTLAVSGLSSGVSSMWCPATGTMATALRSLRTGSFHHLRRASEIHAGAGHGLDARQGRAPEPGWQRAGR
jgi:hypothetical protein